MIKMEFIPKFGGLSGAGCVEKVVVAADMLGLSANSDLNGIALVLRVHVHAVYACFVSGVAALVFAIFRLWHIAQIGNAIIRSVTVDVVNLVFGPAPEMIKPCKPVGLVDFPEYAYSPVALCVDAAHNGAGLPSLKFGAKLIPAAAYAAREYAGQWVVIHKYFKLFLSDHLGTFSQKVVRGLRQPLTRWGSGCIPSRAPSLST